MSRIKAVIVINSEEYWMLTVEKCIDNLNKIDWYDKEINKTGIMQSFKTIKKFETLFYNAHSRHSKSSSTPVIEELKDKIKFLKLQTEDNICVDAWDINPDSTSKYVIICQGISSEKSNQLLQKAYKDFYKNGWGVLIFDYRGRGQSSGTFSRTGAQLDIEAAYNYLKQKGIHSDNIGIIGHSMGTGVAAEFAAKNNIAFLILLNPFSHAVDMAKNIAKKVKMPFVIKQVLKHMPCGMFPLKNKFNNIKALANINKPVLILHNKKDQTIPAELARKLYTSSQKLNITYFELDGDDHEINKEKIKECINFLKHIDNYTSKLIYNSVI